MSRRLLAASALSALLITTLLGCAQRPLGDAGGSTVQVAETEDSYVVTEASDTVLVYQRRPRFPEREHARSHYIHPLYGLGGQILTEDFPDDHPHQHGIFWAWHQIYVGEQRVGDGWTQENIFWDVYDVEVIDRETSAPALRTHVYWKSPRWTDAVGNPLPIVRETATIRVHERREDYRAIDFEIQLQALEDNVRIGGSEDEKGYGGFSTRIRLPEDIQFIGPDGPVEPSTYQVDGGPWLDFVGTFHGSEPSGVAVLTHPSVPDYPQPWILRRSDSMQNVVFPGEEPVRLPTASPLTLRYRLIVHQGSTDAVPLDELHREYAGRTFAATD